VGFECLVSIKNSEHLQPLAQGGLCWYSYEYFCFRLSPPEIFMDLVLTYQELKKAKRIALVFGLNIHQLLEDAGDLKLSAKEFIQAVSLYEHSRVY